MPVQAVFEEVARQISASLPAGIEIVTDVCADVPDVLIDPTQIHRVLMNLGTNAWHAIERPTGQISLRLDAITIAAGTALAARVAPGRHARIEITDDGRGMDAATVERIFEPFFTTKATGKGTGLGLAVVHGVVADHGGTITVDTIPDRGTTFAVYLPEAAVRSSAPELPREPACPGSGRVLLIDDEDIVLRITKRLIERLGYQATTFSRAADAVAAVCADPYRFDVVITDWNMPEMDGLELARALTAVRSDLPIVLVSGNLARSDAELTAANIHHHLEKPFTGASLSYVLDRALKRH